MPREHSSKRLSKTDRKTGIIAAAAAKLFSMKGYIETSMEDIATAAKMSKGGMYYYFSNKCDILSYVLSSFMDLALENIENDLQGITDPSEKIRFIIRRHVKIYNENMYEAKVLLNEVHNLSGRTFTNIRSMEKKYFSIVRGILSSYIASQSDKNTATVITFNLLGMCNWIYSWYNPRGIISPEQLSEIIFDNFTEGLSSFQKES